MKSRFPIPRSLFLRLSLALLFTLLLLGGFQTLAFYLFGLRYAEETVQRANWSVASELSRSLAPVLQHPADAEKLDAALFSISQSFPSMEVYLIDSDGKIRAAFAELEKLRIRQVAMEPIRNFVETPETATLPILGDDPRDPSGKKPFSAAPVRLGNVSGYVYVILQSHLTKLIGQATGQSYAVKVLAFSLSVALLSTAIIGVALFFLLTRRLRELREGVEKFRHAEFSARVSAQGSDDLTEITKAFNVMAENVEHYIQKQQRMDEQRRQFVASVSHDLRSPLTYIRGTLEIILGSSDSDTTGEIRAHALSGLKGVHTLSSLIDNLFELSRLEASESRVQLEAVPLGELIAHVFAQKQAYAQLRQITLHCEATARPAVAEADPLLLERALSNLVENAIKYGKDGGDVYVRLASVGNSVCCTIEDNGLGIPSDALEHLFQPFYRVEANRKAAAGTGLGLALVKRILEAHASTIHVKSEHGAGTSFWFELPLSPEA